MPTENPSFEHWMLVATLSNCQFLCWATTSCFAAGEKGSTAAQIRVEFQDLATATSMIMIHWRQLIARHAPVTLWLHSLIPMLPGSFHCLVFSEIEVVSTSPCIKKCVHYLYEGNCTNLHKKAPTWNNYVTLTNESTSIKQNEML